MEISAYVPRQPRKWCSGGRGFKSPLPDQLELTSLPRQAPRTDNGGAPPMLTVGGRYDLEFGKFATEWRITKRHMRTRYTIGDPAQKAIVGRMS
jgi:hypothetical protein